MPGMRGNEECPDESGHGRLESLRYKTSLAVRVWPGGTCKSDEAKRGFHWSVGPE
jgi:hypothetical protein